MTSKLLQASAKWMFSALEVGDSLALGGDVRIELHPKTTVLVGKNGAGKSAIIEGVKKCAWGAVGVVEEPDPGRFAVEVRMRNEIPLAVRYECRWSRNTRDLPDIDDDDDAVRESGFADIEETCAVIDHEVLWELKDGLLRRNDDSTDTVPPGRGLLNWWMAKGSRRFLFNSMVEPLREMLLFAIATVQTGVPRAENKRGVAIIPYGTNLSRAKRSDKRWEHVPIGIRNLMIRLANWHEEENAKLQEFIDITRRLGLCQDIEITLTPNPEHAADHRAPPYLLGVTVDGINIGLLSDGTLRVFQIIVQLIASTTRLLLLEEPEIAVHPGLLAKLLDEIDAYSTDRQILLSTQSPQVVSWAKPESLRLVERVNGSTRVRSLNDDEQARVAHYLDDKGTLGDYVYAGALDG